MTRTKFSRRNILRMGAAGAAGLALTPALGGVFGGRGQAHAQDSQPSRFLFVLAAEGGASIIDSFLPVAVSEVSTPELAERIVAYPDLLIEQPQGSNFRCLRTLPDTGPFQVDYNMSQFVNRYRDDMLVMTVENTSVNHVVAQKRAITGAGIDGGRTIMEAMAMQYGHNLPLPNCNMASSGYVEPGDRDDVPASARSELIIDPRRFAVSMHGSRGIVGAPDATYVEHARAIRQRLETMSPFAQRFSQSRLRQRFLDVRRHLGPQIEAADLITKLMLYQDSPDIPLSELGLESTPEGAKLRERFPDIEIDRVQAQAALAFLLARYGVSCAVTFGPSFEPDFPPEGGLRGTPIAFDFSHTDHVLTQNVMWNRILKTIDGLISLLQQEAYGDGSMWDHSLIYVATDFGRTKQRPAGADQFSSGHDLNNGNLFISPLLKGNQIFGGVDADTGRTYGFDPRTGAPEPGKLMREGHLYSLVAQAMGIDFSGRHDMSGLLRG